MLCIRIRLSQIAILCAALTLTLSGCSGGGVTPVPTVTTVNTSSNPSIFGQSITFAAKVTATAPSGGVPTGTVSFKDGETFLGTGTLDSSGQATFSTNTLSPGTHSITAVFDGNHILLTSTSIALSQIIRVPVLGGGQSMEFSYTAGVQTFIVPDGVTKITVTARGATGGRNYLTCCSNPGLGCIMKATIDVTPRETLYIYVGGQGGDILADWTAGAGGFNGGGNGGNESGGGGGATDIRRTVDDLEHRVVVAGGGGGANESFGGMGGGVTGERGFPRTEEGGYFGGFGGTQSAGGKGGLAHEIPASYNGEDGSLGKGGNGGAGVLGGGGGGGGYYGGGGGCGGTNGDHPSGSGGGGSGYVIPSATDVGWNMGGSYPNGHVTLNW